MYKKICFIITDWKNEKLQNSRILKHEHKTQNLHYVI